MEEIAISNHKLNIFQKLQLRMFLAKKNISFSDFDKAPDFIKNSQGAINPVFDDYLTKQGMFLKNDEYFNDNSFNKGILKDILKSINNNYNLIEVLLRKDKKIFLDLPIEVTYRFLCEYPQGKEIIDELVENNDTGYYYDESEVLNRIMKDRSKDIKKYNNFIINLYYRDLEKFIINHKELLEDNPLLIDKIIKQIAFYDEKNIKKILPYLPPEKKEKLFMEKIEVLRSAEPEEQLEFIRKHKELAKELMFSVQDKFVEENPKENFQYADIHYQIQKMLRNVEYFEYAPIELKTSIFRSKRPRYPDDHNDGHDILTKYLTANPKEIEKIENNFELYRKCQYDLLETFKDMPVDATNLKMEQIKNIFLHTKYFSAPGTVFKGTLGNPGGGSNDIRSYATYQNIRKLSDEQLVELIKTDSNYILIIGSNWDTINYDKCKERFVRIFEELYKDNPNVLKNRDEYIGIINKIVSEQRTAYNPLGEACGLSLEQNAKWGKVDELKILFNASIMNSNSFEDINNYYNAILNEEDSKPYFLHIIRNTYGEDAIEILESRPNLSARTINSLEVFDSRIMKNFSKEMINDFITYNFEGFSSFLDIVKNPERLEKFKKYYEILSSVISEDAKTMQKAIFEFERVEDILDNKIITSIISKTQSSSKNEREEGLKTEKNFLFALASGNIGEAKTIEDIEKYESLLNRRLNKINLNYSKSIIANEVCMNIFGISNDQLELLIKTYGISKEMISGEIKNSMDEMSNYIIKYLETDNIATFLQTEGIHRDPITLFSTIKEIKKNQTEIINSTFLTREKMDKAIEEDILKNPDVPDIERPIYKSLDENGDVVYHLNGYDFAFLVSTINLSYDITLDELLHLEFQGNNSAICTRYCNTALYPITMLRSSRNIFFTQLEGEEIIGAKGNKTLCGDASTLHAPKLINMIGIRRGKITELNDYVKDPLNEISFFRVISEHGKRARNAEGRVIPQFTTEKPTEELKRYGVCQLVIHDEKYRQKNTEKSKDKVMENIEPTR